jgi:putative salt-induced outer membrane protein YdiY
MIKSKRLYGVVLCAAWFLFVGLCSGDQVFLKNGDRLSGQILQISKDSLTLNTLYAGYIRVTLEEVASLSTDNAMQVSRPDGTIVSRKLEISDPGRVNLVEDPNQPSQAETVLLSEITVMQEQSAQAKWKGNLAGGLTMMSGNTSSESISTSLDLQKRSKTDRVTFAGEMAHTAQEDHDTGEENTTEDWWKTRGKYDYFLTRKFYVFGNGRYETDRVADLTRRVVFGGGPGYQWYESPALNFLTEAGIAEVIEEYEDDTNTTKEISYQFGSHLDSQLNRKLKVLHDFSYFPSMEQFSDYYLTTSGELRYGLTHKLFASFKVIFDYDSTPAEDADATDIKYMLGIGYEF